MSSFLLTPDARNRVIEREKATTQEGAKNRT